MRELDAQLAEVRGRLRLLEARSRLHLALGSLDARNFGIAQGHVTKATELLSSSAAAKPKLKTLLAELKDLNLLDGDFNQRRTLLSRLGTRLDRILPGP